MKHIKTKITLLSFLLTLLYSSAETQTQVPEWFLSYASSYEKVHSNYHSELNQIKELRTQKKFEPQLINLKKAGQITISVEGLDHLILSIQRDRKDLKWGYITNPTLIDAEGNEHPIELGQEHVLTGSISRTEHQGSTHYTLGICILKIKLEGKYKSFRVQYKRQSALLLMDVASEYLLKQNSLKVWAKEENDILTQFTEARKANGPAFELKSGISNWLIQKKQSNSLLAFYRDHANKKLLPLIDSNKNSGKNLNDLYKLRMAFVQSQKVNKTLAQLSHFNTNSLKLAINDLKSTHHDAYAKADYYLKNVVEFENRREALLAALTSGDLSVQPEIEHYLETFEEALLSNPILDFDKIMLLKRDVTRSRTRMLKNFGFPSLNSHNNNKIMDIDGDWHNSVCVLSDLRGDKKLQTLFDAKEKKLITDLELNFNRENILFSMQDEDTQWHIYETDIQGNNLAFVTPDTLPDVNHFDACYLPDGNIVFTSDATYQGLPCEGGSRPMSLLYKIDRKTGKIRQLTFDQDSDFSPAILNNGKLIYLRWEYSDLPHYFSRILMSCNPDGTDQMEYYGSNSYFPNTFIYARPIPNDPTKVVGIVGGHHGITRSGRMMIIDPAIGQSEAEGVVHEFPHRGRKVEPVIKDQLVAGVWPQFIHPYPLNDKYFLVTAKLNATSLWGIYMVDVFDNITLIKEIEGSGLFDPIPLRKEPVPPLIPDKIQEGNKEATVFLSDIYVGDGLKNIPKGTVKNLRLFAYHFAHISSGGHASVGVESSWDIKRVLGTVPVEEDGSAMFKVPANTPISIQPLDSSGKALQIMRSWFVGMPGESVSCVGCHERKSQAPPNMYSMASRRAPSAIKLWKGNARPFSFRYEVQPVLDRNCVSCHNGKKSSIPDFRKHPLVDMEGRSRQEFFLNDKAYTSLHPYVRRPGPESDVHMFNPMEYDAGTSELIQLLQRGHHGVQLSEGDWETLYAWIDLNAPYRGKWAPPEFRKFDQNERRKCLSKEYANLTIDPEAEYDSLVAYLENIKIEPRKMKRPKKINYTRPQVDEWPLSEMQAKAKQNELSEKAVEYTLENNEKIKFVGIPTGKYIKGNPKGYTDERKLEKINITDPFYMSQYEITNAQYALFDPDHNSRFIDQQWKDHTTPGYPANLPNQPVIRVSYNEAVQFCRWLSKRLGKKVSLPSEDQWEWACRAGSEKDFWFSDQSFSNFENLADMTVQEFAVRGVNPRYIGEDHPAFPYYAFIPRDKNVVDGNMITSTVGSYKANIWGLYDMQGNVAEWTSSSYKRTGTDQDQFYSQSMKVVKGGSWRDRPKRAKAGSKRYYLPYQKVYNVGFRVVIED